MMDRIELLEHIRSLIRSALQRHGAASDSALEEAMLIRGGLFCGRQFASDGLHAVWFVEENEIKVYGSDGRILEALALDATQRPRRAA